jgi:deoxycytidylate deaminase
VKNSRIEKKIAVYTQIVQLISELSQASTTKVGCLTIKRDFTKIASFGYNGSYPGAPINPETNSEEESLLPGESGLIHAEINMIAKFREPDPQNYIVLLTIAPCKACTKVLCTAGFKFVYWVEEYRETKHLNIFDECNISYGKIDKLISIYNYL